MTNLAGKIALVTGSTDGVGRMVARRLAEAGAEVFVHGRDAAPRRGKSSPKSRRAADSAHFIAADLADLDEVRRLAETGRADRRSGSTCSINNAGIGSGGSGATRRTNAAGRELRFAVNYLAGFALTLRAAAVAAGERAGSHRQRRLGRPAGDRFRRRHADARLFAARAPICRANWRRSCSPSISRSACAGPASPSIACIRRPIWRRRWCARRA